MAKFIGNVILDTTDRKTVILDTGEKQYVLKRKGGDPIQDPIVDALIGKRISCEGTNYCNLVRMHTWEVI